MVISAFHSDVAVASRSTMIMAPNRALMRSRTNSSFAHREIVGLPQFVREEWLIRVLDLTLKENLLWPRNFALLEGSETALIGVHEISRVTWLV